MTPPPPPKELIAARPTEGTNNDETPEAKDVYMGASFSSFSNSFFVFVAAFDVAFAVFPPEFPPWW